MMDDVFSMIKKSMAFSMGLMAYSVDKTAEVIDEVVKKGDKIMGKYEDTIDKLKWTDKDIDKKVSELVAKTIEKMNIPTKKDIEDLNKKLDTIAKKL